MDWLDALECVLGSPVQALSLHEPSFSGREREYVLDCIDSGWVSSVGSYVDAFEKKISEITGAEFSVVVVNGTAALHLGLLLLGVQSSDLVLVPAISFVATANAVVHAGARPYFVDIDEVSLGMCASRLEEELKKNVVKRNGVPTDRMTGRRLAAMIPMHALGMPCDMDRLIALSEHYDIPILEDAAEALGSRYHGRPVGPLGKIGIFSFNGNKIVTTGGGGALVTHDPDYAQRAKFLSTTGKRPHAWNFFHEEVAWNYRMPNINAALGLAQLEQLPAFLKAKRVLADRYREIFKGVPGVRCFKGWPNTESNAWLNAIAFDDMNSERLSFELEKAHARGYQCRPLWTALHRLPMYEQDQRAFDLSCAESLEQRVICLPSSAFLGERA